MTPEQAAAAVAHPRFIELLGPPDTHFKDAADATFLPSRWAQLMLGVSPGILSAAERQRRVHLYINDSHPATFDDAYHNGFLRPFQGQITPHYTAAEVAGDTSGKRHGLQVVAVMHSVSPIGDNRLDVNLGAGQADMDFVTGEVGNYSNATGVTRIPSQIAIKSAGNSGAAYGPRQSHNLLQIGSLSAAGYPSTFSDRGSAQSNFAFMALPSHGMGPTVGVHSGISGLPDFGGTSGAAPLMTGIVAQLLKAVQLHTSTPRPAEPDDVLLALLATDLRAPTLDGGGRHYDPTYGYGMPNVRRALALLREDYRLLAEIRQRVEAEYQALVQAQGQSAADEVALYDGHRIKWFFKQHPDVLQALQERVVVTNPLGPNDFWTLVHEAPDVDGYYDLIERLFRTHFLQPRDYRIRMIRDFFTTSGFPFFGVFFHAPWYVDLIADDSSDGRVYLEEVVRYYQTLPDVATDERFGAQTDVHDWSTSVAAAEVLCDLLMTTQTRNPALFASLRGHPKLAAFQASLGRRLGPDAGQRNHSLISHLWLSHQLLAYFIDGSVDAAAIVDGYGKQLDRMVEHHLVCRYLRVRYAVDPVMKAAVDRPATPQRVHAVLFC